MTTKPFPLALARQMVRDLADEHGTSIVESGDVGFRAAREILGVLKSLVPAAEAPTDAVLSHFGRVSVTLPIPGIGTVIYLALPEAPEGVGYAKLGGHELTHDDQIQTLGGGAVAHNYLGSGELRAKAEAQARVTEAFVEFRLTGNLPTPEDAARFLSSGTYHLSADDTELGRGIIEQGFAAIRKGLVPPITTCIRIDRWLRKHATEYIVGQLAS